MFDDIIYYFSQEITSLGHVTVASVLGLIMGIERAFHHKAASLRTFGLLTAGSCLFTILSLKVGQQAGVDSARIASNIITGIGFLGGGVIFKAPEKVEGITTGSMIWFAAAIGMCCGFGYIALSVFCVIIYLITIYIGILGHKIVKLLMKETE